MLKSNGFSLLETMLAVALMASLAVGIYRLQLAELAAVQQILIRQQLLAAASNISNQIYADLNYVAANSNRRGVRYYAETRYDEHSSPALTTCNAAISCDAPRYASFVLAQWKQGFRSMGLPPEKIFALVCLDSGFTPPTLSSPNCSGHGRLLVKIAWQSHWLQSESAPLGANNYIILPVPSR